MTPTGTLYGIGTGPGAPDLLTIRAVDLLRSAQVVITAASSTREYSSALAAARPYLPEEAELIRLEFPMTREREVLAEAWENNAATVAGIVRGGRDAVFLTLGDPLIYSTFGYLMRVLARLAPEIPVEVVPGITSYQEAAARSRTVLCEGEENLVLISGINRPEVLERAMDHADSAVILKAYTNRPLILRCLERAGKKKQALYASRLGMEGEFLSRDLDRLPDRPGYFSLILAPPPREDI